MQKASVKVLLILSTWTIFGTWFSYKWVLNVGSSHGQLVVLANSNTTKRPYFIFECKKGFNCGGLADRQKGIVTAYILSQILNTRFGIYVNKPCLLTNYLVPNEVDWMVPSNFSETKNSTLWNRMGRYSLVRDLTLPNITSKVKSDVIFYRGNIDRVPELMTNPLYKNLSWTKGLGYLDLYKHVYDKLFKLSSSTQKRLDDFLKVVGEDKLFCVHLRMGRNPDMRYDDKRPHSAPNVTLVVEFLQKLVKRERSYRVFIASDSSSAKSKFTEPFGSRLIDIEGPIAHMELTSDCDGIEKGILDQKVLSLCDTLIMSVSGFGRMAAVMRGSDDNLYQIMKNNITKVMRLTPSLYKIPK